MKPVVELVTTGAELLNGRVVNRHAAWLGGQLEKIGWRLQRDTTVADDETSIQEAISSSLGRCDIVVVSGGLGPTIDDVTRDVAAAWVDAKIIMHEPTRRIVIEVYHARNKPLNDSVERHALVVEGADVLTNHYGLAPGEHLTKNGQHVFLLPGPPREFQGVAGDYVLPWLTAQGVAPAVRLFTFQVVGLGESDIVSRLEGHGFHRLNIETAYCAEPGRVSIRIREKSGESADFDRAGEMVRHLLRENIYAETDESIEQVLGRLLAAHGKTIGVAESCTGGMIGQRLTSIPGSSAYVRGGVIAYHDEVKRSVLGVTPEVLKDFGAVSEQTATAMARGVRELVGSDIGLSVTGIAGPDGGSPEKPVGLVYIACADGTSTVTKRLHLGGGRDVIREASAMMAMDLARNVLHAKESC